MSEYEPFGSRSETGDSDEVLEQDDIQDVVAALQRLAQNTGHPVVRACLEQARDDIIHLTA